MYGSPTSGPARLRGIPTGELSVAEARSIRDLLTRAFETSPEEAFSQGDWLHALGGMHVVLELEGAVAAHASVVPRELRVAGRPLRTGYVEAVAVEPALQGRGLGTAVMRWAGRHIEAVYELGALGTGEHHFYERLGWRIWRGPSSVRTVSGEIRTPDEDGYIMVLLTPHSPQLELSAPISCDWRPGDAW